MFKIFNDSKLVVEEDAGKILVSTDIRDKDGKLIAEILRMNGRHVRPDCGIGISTKTNWTPATRMGTCSSSSRAS
jgi:hypothetical protein